MVAEILGMALLTNLTRAGGVLLMGSVPVKPRVEAFLPPAVQLRPRHPRGIEGTKGFDTPDWQEAKTLLDGLR